MTRQKSKRGDRKVESKDSPMVPDSWTHQTHTASLRGTLWELTSPGLPSGDLVGTDITRSPFGGSCRNWHHPTYHWRPQTIQIIRIHAPRHIIVNTDKEKRDKKIKNRKGSLGHWVTGTCATVWQCFLNVGENHHVTFMAVFPNDLPQRCCKTSRQFRLFMRAYEKCSYRNRTRVVGNTGGGVVAVPNWILLDG